MKLGIVNDLPLAAEALRRAVALRPEHRVIWTARHGAEAVEFCRHHRPDLVLMDLTMPVMSGVEATRRIMAESPCAILIVTVSVSANAGQVYEAMGYGALDAVDTPALGVGDPACGAAPLLGKIDLIGKLVRDAGNRAGPGELHPRAAAPRPGGWLVAIGASAGGPAALAQVLQALPPDFPAAVAIVQHVDAQFAPGMAEWLGTRSRLPVRVAAEGDAPAPGVVWVAGRDDHLVLLESRVLGYTPHPEDCPYRPSVDVFFQSALKHWRGRLAGVLLTGMGRDGAKGLKTMRDAGVRTIAQDRASCAVYGMPKAAAELGAAGEILPLDRIAPRLAAYATERT